MYLNFYNLKEEPFQLTPDPEFLFLSPSHKEALASIIYGVEQRKGFVTITGEVGVGKTTVLRSYLEDIDKETLKTIYIFNPNLSFSSLLKRIFEELEIDAETEDPAGMVTQLYRILIDEYKKGRVMALIIDEAQNMPIETLENLRMLSNLETSKEKLIQIVLVGQPEFGEMLKRKELRQLRQRIAVKATISSLTKEECMAYIQHRLTKASLRGSTVFTQRALRKIIDHAHGIPRLLNVYCDNALITGFGYQKDRITAGIAKEVIADFQKKRTPLSVKWGFAVIAILLLGGIFSVFLYGEYVLSGMGFMPKFSWQEKPVSQNGENTGSPQSARSEELRAENTKLKDKEQEYTSLLAKAEERQKTDKDLADDAVQLQKEASAEARKYREQIDRLQADNRQLSNRIEDMKHQTEQQGKDMKIPAASLTKPMFTNKAGAAQTQSSIMSDEETRPVMPDSIQKPALSEAKKESDPVVRSIRKGDNLLKLVREIYGYSDQKLIKLVMQNNPGITSVDKIRIGDEIFFPVNNHVQR